MILLFVIYVLQAIYFIMFQDLVPLVVVELAYCFDHASREIVLLHLSVVCAVHLLKMSNTIFLFCPSFAALRETLFSSAAHLLRDKGLFASDKRKFDFLLNGVSGIDFQINVTCFLLFSLLSLNQIVFRSCFFVFCLFVCFFRSVTIKKFNAALAL